MRRLLALRQERPGLLGSTTYRPLDVLREARRVLRDDGRPFFVRIGPECNGHWNGYDPELFPRAFRHVADLLRREGVPSAIEMIEALASGTPVLAFPEGAAAEIVIDGHNGMLVADEAEIHIQLEARQGCCLKCFASIAFAGGDV